MTLIDLGDAKIVTQTLGKYPPLEAMLYPRNP